MSEVQTDFVDVAGGSCRIMRAGTGRRVGVIPGHRGLPRWTPFLDILSQQFDVTLLSLPGFPGSEAHHQTLDGHLDWIAATLDLLDAANLRGADLVCASVAGMLASEVAALAPGFVRRLSLTGPYGLYTSEEPVVDLFAHTPEEIVGLLAESKDHYDEAFGEPNDPEAAAQWQLMLYRSDSASARLYWPFGDRGLRKRLRRIEAPVQLLWGANDRVVPPGYLGRFTELLGKSAAETGAIPDAGHLAWIDQPKICGETIASFLDRP